MDFYPGGDLCMLCDKFEYGFSESMARFYVAEIAVALDVIHSLGCALCVVCSTLRATRLACDRYHGLFDGIHNLRRATTTTTTTSPASPSALTTHNARTHVLGEQICTPRFAPRQRVYRRSGSRVRR